MSRNPRTTTDNDPSARFQSLALSDPHSQHHTKPSTSTSTSSSHTHPPQTPTPHSHHDPTDPNLSPHSLALQTELLTLRRLNTVLDSTIHSLQHAHTSMSTTSQTIASASSLLTLWTRILSQTEHTSRLVLNPAWKGASQDQADAEGEVLARERKEREESRRREVMEGERRRAEDERARMLEVSGAGLSSSERGGRGGSVRGRGVGSRVRGTTRSVSGGTGTARSGMQATDSTTTGGRGGGSVRRTAAVGYGRVGSVGTTRAGRTRGTAGGRGLG